MIGSAFLRYDLRTTDPDAARAFYAEALGLDVKPGLSPGEPSMVAVWLLHEQARARGAPPHWLGHIGVADVEAAARRFVELGGERLGSTLRANDGTPYAMLRDPLGAVIAVRAGSPRPPRSPVAWHHLHTTDADRTWALYADLCGWTCTDTIDDVPDAPDGYRAFTWDGERESVGSMANTARAPGVHVHWLYYFRVANLDASLAKVAAHGGRPGAPTRLPNGRRLAPCEDPQGAAFGLFQ